MGISLDANHVFSLKTSTTGERGGMRSVDNLSGTNKNFSTYRAVNINASIGTATVSYDRSLGVIVDKAEKGYVTPDPLAVGGNVSTFITPVIYYETERKNSESNADVTVFTNNGTAFPSSLTTGASYIIVLRDRLMLGQKLRISYGNGSDYFNTYYLGDSLSPEVCDLPTNIALEFYATNTGELEYRGPYHIYESLSTNSSPYVQYLVKGTPNTNNFLRGDGTWQPAGGSTII